MTRELEVFQDLNLKARSADISIRDHVLAATNGPWRHDQSREKESGTYAMQGDVIILARERSDGLEAANLVLWQCDDGYRVSNIVPVSVGELGISKYNAILSDFAQRIAIPAAAAGGFDVQITSAHQAPEDWLGEEPARLLRAFSQLANKSTGAGHPLDERRWFDFVIAVYKSERRADSEILRRWLAEVENWPTEAASELAGDYEVALGLLARYDAQRA